MKNEWGMNVICLVVELLRGAASASTCIHAFIITFALFRVDGDRRFGFIDQISFVGV